MDFFFCNEFCPLLMCVVFFLFFPGSETGGRVSEPMEQWSWRWRVEEPTNQFRGANQARNYGAEQINIQTPKQLGDQLGFCGRSVHLRELFTRKSFHSRFLLSWFYPSHFFFFFVSLALSCIEQEHISRNLEA